MPEQNWQVHISFTEEDSRTRADAILELADHRFHGFGQAKRASEDPSIPLIGQNLAAARALSHLSHQVLDAVLERIEASVGHSARVHD